MLESFLVELSRVWFCEQFRPRQWGVGVLLRVAVFVVDASVYCWVEVLDFR